MERSLAWGGKELDKTEQPTLSLFYYFTPTSTKISESPRLHRNLYHQHKQKSMSVIDSLQDYLLPCFLQI